MLDRHRLVIREAFRDHVWIARSIYTALFVWIPGMVIRYALVKHMPEWYEQIAWLAIGGIILILMLGLVIDYAVHRNQKIDDLIEAAKPRLKLTRIIEDEQGHYWLDIVNSGSSLADKCSASITRLIDSNGRSALSKLPSELLPIEHYETPQNKRPPNGEFTLQGKKPTRVYLGHLTENQGQKLLYFWHSGPYKQPTWVILDFSKVWIEFALYSAGNDPEYVTYLLAFSEHGSAIYRWPSWPSQEEQQRINPLDPFKDKII